jgi:hypothetical protein
MLHTCTVPVANTACYAAVNAPPARLQSRRQPEPSGSPPSALAVGHTRLRRQKTSRYGNNQCC